MEYVQLLKSRLWATGQDKRKREKGEKEKKKGRTYKFKMA